MYLTKYLYCNDCGVNMGKFTHYRNCYKCSQKVKMGTLFNECQLCHKPKKQSIYGLCDECQEIIRNANKYALN